MSFGNWGQPSQNQQQSTFGATSSTPALGAFGQTQQNTQPAAAPTWGGFGANNNQQQQQAQQQAQQAPQTGGLGLFGAAPQNQTQGTSTGLFGSTPAITVTAANGNNTTSAWGANNSTTTTGFGAPAAPTNTGFGGFGLGGNMQNQQQQQQQPGTGTTSNLFGSSIVPLAGQNANNNTQQPQQQQPFGSSIFGSSTLAPSTSTGGGLFGSTFGQQQQQQQQQPAQQQQQQPQSSIFGNSLRPTQSTLSFAGSGTQTPSGGIFGSSTTAQQQQPQQAFGSDPSASSQPTVKDQIQELVSTWDPQSAKCRFQHYFYNYVDPQQIGQYTRPANATNEVLWKKACDENPNPSCLVPVLAVGFEDLKKRVDAQSKQASAHQAKLQEIQKKLATLAENHALRTSSRASQATLNHLSLTQRLSALVAHLHLLIPILRSSALRPEEERLSGLLESLETELRKPGGLGRVGGKMGELWGAVGKLRAARDNMGSAVAEGRWAVVDEEGLREISNVLHEQQQGLTYLTNILRDAQRDLDVIRSSAPGRGSSPSNSFYSPSR
ncbi:hypothetical protein BOTBODRAFT_168059 [Botryobasidium botryosum FD-172 SS1]|uniref:Nucleoporin Nup54 alpha-helical domain-containing protein n=1 Tax=Botryobasidium botryosum (strain FD-172 SS1) TaxID=930990 RepID=A0A067LTP0_BOTB1|nr:hypothetical protein BOTBODRAFT_168059 [Botryobasidium botryosum FD-172 SS1]